ncbi:hypothetical protein LZ009_19465 [Ramlibacter sp. XY19]|uniref:tetratricopeptide repeat protein n=1 Tax=Ramlibacter paludis TaxID=2908000 RepID=UPI0023DA027D|nr:tetratricopeptide repeat protein [Ramlibacter paludis]MCG2594963.1 hypothetical protein [Ramlibacter paludis]
MSKAADRLARLEGYLAEDPQNPVLLAEACDVAIEAGLHARARQHIEAGQRSAPAPVPWLWRHARLAIAQRAFDAAAASLDQLQSLVGPDAAVTHDRAYVHFLQQDFAACRALLAPWVAGAATHEHRDALHALWLRATHAAGLVQEAWDWVIARRPELGPAAQGVASLLAVDVGDFAAAKALADGALAGGTSHEALVARASVALAQKDGAGANRWLAQAMQRNPEDGRTWMLLGLVSLLEGEFRNARSQLERALTWMPTHIGTWHALGWTHLVQRDLPEARKAMEQALALDANFAESHGALGLVLALQGERPSAERHLAIARKLDPHNVSGRYAQALMHGEVADLERLQVLIRKLMDRPGLFGGRMAEDILSGR